MKAPGLFGRRPARDAVAMVALVVGMAVAAAGCTSPPPGNSRGATLPADAVGDNNLQFLGNRKPVPAPGDECAAFTPRLRAVAGIGQGSTPTPMEPGHGCWAEGADDDMVSILTTATPFGEFWRRDYPDDDGSGITAVMVDKNAAQLFERFILQQRYYAVRIGSRWAAGLDSGVTKTACMLVVDTGSPKPLLINVTQQISASGGTAQTVSRQCDLSATIARTLLDEQDPGGGSRVP